MENEVLKKIREIKIKYEPEGFIIIGIFSSFARGEETADSDMDILYELSPTALEKYPGLRFFGLYERVKRDFEESLSMPVDLADKSALSDIGRKYILPEVRYVA